MDKKNKVDIKSLLKTPRGRGIVFFAAYGIFFLAFFILVRFGSRGAPIGTGYEEGNASSNVSFTAIENNNYSFNYTITVDGNVANYIGSRYDDSETFTYNGLEYYRNGNNFLVNSNGNFIKSENPYLYYQLLSIDNISEILKTSSLESKTEYDSGKVTYNLLASTDSITKVLDDALCDIEEVPNIIVFSSNTDGDVDTINMSLDSYCKYKNICANSMSISLNYDNFSKIKEISSPLE